MIRIGPKMRQVTNIVASFPGHPMLLVAKTIEPLSTNLGYRVIRRAIKAGLIYATKDQNKRYILYMGARQS